MHYEILIDYTTGDSYGSKRITDEAIGTVTTDLDKAKENLRRIKGHYLKYVDGFAANADDLKLLTDNGEIKEYPFWIWIF